MQACTSPRETKQIPAVYILEQSCTQPQASTRPQTQRLPDMRRRQRAWAISRLELLLIQQRGSQWLCSLWWSVPTHSLCHLASSEQKENRGETERGSVCFLLFTHKYLHLPFLGQHCRICTPQVTGKFTHNCWCWCLREERCSCPVVTHTQRLMHKCNTAATSDTVW